MKLIIGNVNTKIEYYENQQFLDWFDKKIHETIDPLDPQRYRKAAYRRHYWDGRINFYDMKNKTFPTGLYPDVVNLIKATQQIYPSLEMTVEDTRKPAIGINQLEDKIVIKDTPKGDLVLDPNDPVRGYQYEAVKFCLEEQRGFVNASTGSGKAIYDETLIPTPSGVWKKVKDIHVGDLLLGQNGKPTRVLARYPQPVKELYKVSLMDGRSFIVCGEHLIPIYSRSQSKPRTIENLKTKSVNDILDDYKSIYTGKDGVLHNHYKYAIPQSSSVEYGEQKHLIPPYALGVLLSEGSLNDINRIKNLTISTNEEDILQKFMLKLGLEKYTNAGENYGYSFSQKNNTKVLAICNEILRLNLAHIASDKFIPNEYLIDSVKHRLELLQGLIDTDGSIVNSKGRKSYSVSFSTSSKKMLHTFLNLVDSLGFGRKVYVDKRKKTNINYTIAIFTPMKIWTSAKHSKRVQKLEYRSNKDSYTPIINIESVGFKPSTCFTVDNKDKLFLVNDYIVTHNTVIAEALIQLDLKELDTSEKILFIVHNKIIAYQTKKRFEESLHIPIGFWGDGQKDIQQVTVCLVGTIASGLKKPEDVIKLTSNKDKILKNLVTVYIPYFKDYPNLKYVIKSYINNNKPKYAYEEPLWETFSDMVQPEVTNDDILKWFKAYEKQYQKLLRKKASKTYDKYNETMDILNATKVVIIDESQHTSSNQYQLVMGNLFNARQRIGLSGTIIQSDPVKWGAMKAIMSDKLFKITNKQMIDSGVSAKPYIQFLPINVPTDLDEQVKDLMPANMDENKMALQLYQETYRAGIIENEYRNGVITALLEKLQATNKSTLVVVKSIEHGEILQAMLDKKGIDSDFLRGDLSFDERADVIERIKQGSAKIVFGTTIVNEGMDIPNLKYLVYASAGSSPIEVLQRIGRVLRKAKGKDTTIIYDFMDKMSKVLYSQAKERKNIYKKEEFQLLG